MIALCGDKQSSLDKPSAIIHLTESSFLAIVALRYVVSLDLRVLSF